jgi:hypothetical protein
MYNEITKTQTFKHIYKFHTKSIIKAFRELTEYLLHISLENLLKENDSTCNCIGNPYYYLQIDSDTYNNKLKNQHNSKINTNGSFVMGTIFYTKDIVLNNVIEFIKNNNYRSYLLNNLYENNSINYDYSPIHFLERLFGVIKC